MIQTFNEYAKESRRRAKLTLEKAAEELNVASRTLAYYEAGDLKINDDVAQRMALAYKDPLLPYRWLSTTACGQYCLPNLERKNFAEAILDILGCQKNLELISPRLIAIGADGKINKDKLEEYEQICKKFLEPMIKASIALMFFKEHKKKSPQKGRPKQSKCATY